VGFSTTFQNQLEVLRRVIVALGEFDVRAVVTAGPAVDIASLPNVPNVHVCTSAPHSQLLKESAAVVTHAGHVTVIRALATGVPMVCMPMGRDQNENAARVVFHGAGVRIRPTSSAAQIRRALRTLLDSSCYRECAGRLGHEIVSNARDSGAVAVLEAVANRDAGR